MRLARCIHDLETAEQNDLVVFIRLILSNAGTFFLYLLSPSLFFTECHFQPQKASSCVITAASSSPQVWMEDWCQASFFGRDPLKPTWQPKTPHLISKSEKPGMVSSTRLDHRMTHDAKGDGWSMRNLRLWKFQGTSDKNWALAQGNISSNSTGRIHIQAEQLPLKTCLLYINLDVSKQEIRSLLVLHVRKDMFALNEYRFPYKGCLN